MAKKVKQKIQLVEGVDPGLFGQKYSCSRQNLKHPESVKTRLRISYLVMGKNCLGQKEDLTPIS